MHFAWCDLITPLDQEITLVVVVVLFHLSHFLFKRNISEKKLSRPGNEHGSLSMPVKHSINYPLSNSNINTILLENYLVNLRILKNRP